MSDQPEASLPELMIMPTGVGEVEMNKYYRPSDKLPVRLFGTDLGYGDLHLSVETDGPPDWMADAPSGGGIHHRVYSTNLIVDPTWGVTVATFANWGPTYDLVEAIDQAAERAQLRCEFLEEALREAGWPDEGELPLGMAVLYPGDEELPEPDAYECDSAIVVKTGDWRELPTRLREIARYYVCDTDNPPGEVGEKLAEAIQALDGRSHCYFDHLRCVRDLGVTTPQLLEKQSAA